MKIATWNINGFKARLETALTWLAQAEPDIVCLQEIKSINEGFPAERFEELGYSVALHGQKGFNGVAYFAKLKAALKPGGRVAIIDFRLDAPAGAPRHMQITAKQIEAEMAAAGYARAQAFDFLTRQNFLVFAPAPD